MTTKQLNLKNRTYYFYNDLINIKNFDHNNVNPLYLMISRINGHFEEVDGNKYLIISSENGNIMQKYQEVFDGIK